MILAGPKLSCRQKSTSSSAQNQGVTYDDKDSKNDNGNTKIEKQIGYKDLLIR